MRKRNGEWIAESPYDLIGWDIVSIEKSGNKFIIHVEKKDTRETRIVNASEEAVPIYVMERFKR